jgi:serine/threonine protein kinase
MDVPPDGMSVLEVLVARRLTECECLELESTQQFQFNDDDSVNINGFRVSTTSMVPSAAWVSSLEELDLEHAVLLGRGAGGSVSKVLHKPSGKEFAVKLIHVDDGSVEQIKNEAALLMQGVGESPFVVQCHQIFYHATSVYMVIELMDGSLKDLLLKKQFATEGECAAIAYQLMRGLHYLHVHRQRMHRDIKPHNVLYRVSDGSVKLADFGISKKMESVAGRVMDTYCGTLKYMSPERVQGQPYSFEGDIWSVGITLMELALGSVPFDARLFSVAKLRQDTPALPPVSPQGNPLSGEFRDFIALCLSPPSPAFPTAEELMKHPWLVSVTESSSRDTVKGFPA